MSSDSLGLVERCACVDSDKTMRGLSSTQAMIMIATILMMMMVIIITIALAVKNMMMMVMTRIQNWR